MGQPAVLANRETRRPQCRSQHLLQTLHRRPCYWTLCWSWISRRRRSLRRRHTLMEGWLPCCITLDPSPQCAFVRLIFRRNCYACRCYNSVQLRLPKVAFRGPRLQAPIVPTCRHLLTTRHVSRPRGHPSSASIPERGILSVRQVTPLDVLNRIHSST